MIEQVVLVIYKNPTAAGPIVKKVFKFYGDAELFVKRQVDPAEYILSAMTVRRKSFKETQLLLVFGMLESIRKRSLE